MTHGLYKVTGHRKYRGHEPGTIFEALIPAQVEARAVQRGDITVLNRITPALQPGSYTLPDDWPPFEADNQQTGGAERRLSHR